MRHLRTHNLRVLLHVVDEIFALGDAKDLEGNYVNETARKAEIT